MRSLKNGVKKKEKARISPHSLEIYIKFFIYLSIYFLGSRRHKDTTCNLKKEIRVLLFPEKKFFFFYMVYGD